MLNRKMRDCIFVGYQIFGDTNFQDGLELLWRKVSWLTQKILVGHGVTIAYLKISCWIYFNGYSIKYSVPYKNTITAIYIYRLKIILTRTKFLNQEKKFLPHGNNSW